ncbi:type VI secretion system Vgr family protein [Pluralibacter gergoviae]|uniref:type VI secretion system Vgr family protein n=1 Tax=Pluralibacter gergoviae TaxID=61647 RepID=UPI000A36BCE1|nr:type VI secretion system Vgr family protein [Pluralibacter gergoviae]EKT9642855.1 type VI secretion system tip protein VgrG [Pluralibacter gergoviae]EKV3546458.1 type VI secretion system tip protein VgrG [Pluralibacter gergoviae]EKV9901209.1 type VI secretion system tip protein VgrG [Pluralibacter gergoviae]EKV9932864.1 type VI secretion system tip protein VgrG [Pluralibacter gergoviae]EKW9978325.1 type VI secretion system tip protein VgrG [Pluralibacter gergoviae]
MNLTNSLSSLTERVGLNRYHLHIPSCSSPLDVEEFSGREFMSELYHYTVLFTSTDLNISPVQMLNKPATLTMGTGSLMALSGQKVVPGVVTHFKRIGGSRDQAKYQITLEPFLSLLRNQFRTHRFFVNKSVADVVEEVLRDHGLKEWEYHFVLKADYPVREQINQYRESDLAFIERLLSEVGIFYFFTLHPETQTEVVNFGDKQSAWQFDKILPLSSPSGENDNGVSSVWGIDVRHNVAERSVTANDYNHREAQKILLSAPADMTYGEGEAVTYGDVYHYRARHLETGAKITPAAETGNFLARLEHERFLSGQTTVTGYSTDATLSPAQVLTISEVAVPPTLPSGAENGIIITSVGYMASRKEALIVMWEGMPYSETRCWRPPARPRPVISGTLTARVTSAKSNDIYAWQDASGMYRVKFDADRDGKSQGQESMPVRLAKPYGGDVYGFHFPLIQGTEVAIAFHEGDPDRPYIAHAMHDSRHVDHVTEKNHTRNVIRTPTNNKLRMEDERGKEHIKLSTEYGGKTQLNLGHNVDTSRSLRGEGAELRTDKWVAIRGGSGVFITADAQQQAQGDMLAMQVALSQLQQAQQLTQSLRGAAEVAKAELADLQSQKALLSEAITQLKQSVLLLSAPSGIAQTTAKSLQLSAGQNIITTSGENTDFSVLKAFRVAAGELISLFAEKMGIKIFAAKGRVEIQAQSDELALNALKDIRVSSSEGKIIIRAEQDILLIGSGGAYIRIGNGEVESGAPDKIIQRAAVWQKFSGQSASVMAQKWDKADFSYTPKAIHLYDGEALPAQNMVVKSEDDGIKILSTAQNGKATLQKQSGVAADRMQFKDNK